jgi:hypothetical protein
VAPPNHAPEVVPIPDQRAMVGELFQFTATALDPDGDALVWDAVALPPGASFDAGTAAFAWTPTTADVGNRFALLRVTDLATPPLSALLLVDIEVVAASIPTNLPPILWSVPADGQADPCVPFSASFEAVDPEGTPLHYTVQGLPAGATLTEDGQTVVLDWTPTSAQSGTHLIMLHVTDEGLPPMSDGIVYRIEVRALPAPVIEPISDVVVAGGSPGVITPVYPRETCYDVNVITTLPVTWDGDTLTWTTDVNDFGIYPVTFELVDVSNPVTSYTRTGRFVVQFVDQMSAFTGYGTRDVNLDWCCAGTVSYAVTDGVLHARSDFPTDVHGFAYRIFDRTQVRFVGV